MDTLQINHTLLLSTIESILTVLAHARSTQLKGKAGMHHCQLIVPLIAKWQRYSAWQQTCLQVGSKANVAQRKLSEIY